MKLRDFPLLTDENLDPDVVAHLRQLGFDVLDVVERGLQGSTDVDLLRLRRRKDVWSSAARAMPTALRGHGDAVMPTQSRGHGTGGMGGWQ